MTLGFVIWPVLRMLAWFAKNAILYLFQYVRYFFVI